MRIYSTWDDLKGTVLFQWIIQSKPHRQNRATSDTPIPVNKAVQFRQKQSLELSVFHFGTTSYLDARPRMEVHLLQHSHQVWLLGIYRWSGSPAGWHHGPGWLWPLVRFWGFWPDPSPRDSEDEHYGGCTGCTLYLETCIQPFTRVNLPHGSEYVLI